MVQLLPVLSEETRQKLQTTSSENLDQWKRQMIHRIKADNPEINALLLEIAQNSNDPKSVIYAGYMVYKAIELAQEEENQEAFEIID